jgi:site-specific DNA recombinase
MDRAGAGLGVQRQVEDCARLIEQRGLTFVETYADNDVSAYSGKARPAYRRLLADMRSGRIDMVVAWHTDRLHRSPRELEEYIEISETHRVETVTVQAGELDLAAASGRMLARMLGAAARHESDQRGERVRRARQQAAQRGLAHGPLGFGYRADHSINPEEAAIVRELADRVLGGETLYSIAKDMNGRSVPSPGGIVGGWRSVTIRQTLMRTTLAGWREWRPGTHDTKGGRGLGAFMARGSWTPILDKETVERIRAVLCDPARRVCRRPPQSLLTGILRCGRCGAPMSSAQGQGSNTRGYACVQQPGLGRCGGIRIVADPVDALVSAAVVEVLAGSKVADARRRNSHGDHDAAEAELVDARTTRDELARMRAAGEISSSEWTTMRKTITERIVRAERLMDAAGVGLSALAGVPTGRRARAWWASAALDQRRTVVRTLVESIAIAPARHGNRFDSSRVGEPIWRI